MKVIAKIGTHSSQSVVVRARKVPAIEPRLEFRDDRPGSAWQPALFHGLIGGGHVWMLELW